MGVGRSRVVRPPRRSDSSVPPRTTTRGGVTAMAETKRMTAEQVVSYLLEEEGVDFLRESLALGRAAADGGGGVGADRRRARGAQFGAAQAPQRLPGADVGD